MTRRNGLVSLVSLAVTGAVVGLLVVGCGIRPTAVIRGQDAPQGAITSLVVYLIDHGTLRAVARPLPPTPTTNPDGTNKVIPYVPPEQQALSELVRGPSATEAAAGMTSEVPNNVFATVGQNQGQSPGNVVPVFVKTASGESLSKHAVDQIACTVITSLAVNSYSDTKPRYQVAVFDSGGEPRPPQGCPLDTP